MNKEEFFKQYAGKYHLVKMKIGGNDCSLAYADGRIKLISSLVAQFEA